MSAAHRPDATGAQALILLAAREGAEAELGAALEAEAKQLLRALPDRRTRVEGLLRVADDPFGAQYPRRRSYEAVLALDADALPAELLPALVQLGARLGPLAHPDLSVALVGTPVPICGAAVGPVRFLYLMRHRRDLTTAAFQHHWRSVHAEFGRRTPGTLGYVQLHVDPEASHAAAAAAGLGLWRFDGVAQLALRSLEDFVRAAVGSEVGREAQEDERRFVDGENSVGLAAESRFRLGATG